MDGVRRLLGLAGLLAGEAAAARLLHRLGGEPWLSVGWEDLSGWLAAVAPEDAVMAVTRLVALAAAYWLLATTVCYTLARMARVPAAVRSVQWATVPAVRRVADRAVAAVLAGSSVAVVAPALAAAAVVAPPAVSAPADLPGDPGVPPPGDASDAAGGATGPAAADPPDGRTGTTSPAPAPRQPGAHTVVPGDNLWTITAAALGGEVSNAAILGPWRVVIDSNRDRLRSGDPNLIYPGEHIVLPRPADAAPPS